MNNIPKQLKQEGLDEIKSNTKLFGDVCDLLEVKATGLLSLLNRRSERLNQFPVVMAVAASLGVSPDDIQEPKTELAKAV